MKPSTGKEKSEPEGAPANNISNGNNDYMALGIWEEVGCWRDIDKLFRIAIGWQREAL